MIVVYIIINHVNGKVYIGSTDNISGRFNKHKRDLNKGIHHNRHLQMAWNKYGSESFEFKTLMVCPEKERNHCEQMMMDLCDAQNYGFGYNIRDADAHSISDETKRRMSVTKNTTGILYVCKHKHKQCEQGFEWRYQYSVDGKQKTISSVDIEKLEDKVRAKGLPWEECE